MNIIKYAFNRKYRFFYDKYTKVEKSIWEHDFKILKSRQIREGVRQDRDREVENRNILETKLPKETDEKVKESLAEQLKVSTEKITRYEAQMKMVDAQINGVKPNDDNTGVVGVLETIESLSELRKMYREYFRNL